MTLPDDLLTRLTLHHARDDDAVAVHTLLTAAGDALARQGFRNWIPHYPLDRVRGDIGEREVYVVHDTDEPVATYTLARAALRAYAPAPWPEPALASLYLNRLAVDPARQGHGIGAWCLQQIATEARSRDMKAIRCDVLEANLGLRGFYERHGYVARGRRTHSGWSFSCYECIL